jgi:hypothetical protein
MDPWNMKISVMNMDEGVSVGCTTLYNNRIIRTIPWMKEAIYVHIQCILNIYSQIDIQNV